MRFNRVADGSTGTVRLDEPDFLRRNTGVSARIPDQPSLGFRARQRDPIRVTVLIQRRADDHALDRIAVGDGLGKTFQQHYPGTFATHETTRARIERRAAPLW